MTGCQGATGGVLLVAVEGPVGRSLLSALREATIEVEWARTLGELRTRVARDDARTPALVFLDLEWPDAATDQLVPLVRTSFPSATTIALAGQLTGERAAQLLSQGVPSLTKPVSPLALTGLAVRLSLGSSAPWSTPPFGAPVAPAPAPPAARSSSPGFGLDSLVDTYATERVLSKQQRTILRLYLAGHNDKEIAQICRCSEATVYEHWRRMARRQSCLPDNILLWSKLCGKAFG